MSNEISPESELISAFEMMWGKYPEPVRLIHRSFTIIAVNEFYKALGGVPGVKCNATNPELHRGCKAMLSLKSNETQSVISEKDGMQRTSFWVPVSGYPDYFIHFTNGYKEYLEKVNNKSEVTKNN